MKFIFSIAGLLIVAILFITVLDKIGMSDVVKDAGNHIRGKTGLSKTNDDGHARKGEEVEKANSSQPSKEVYVKKIIGWNLRDINSKPLDFILDAKRKTQKEIDHLQDKSLEALVQVRESQKRYASDSEELKELKELSEHARLILQDKTTEYPVSIGGYIYTEEMLLQAASDAKNRIRTLEGQQSYTGNNATFHEETYATAQRNLEILQSAMSLLQAKENSLRALELRKDVYAAKAAAGELDDAVRAFFNEEELAKEAPLASPVKRSNEAQLRKNVFSD